MNIARLEATLAHNHNPRIHMSRDDVLALVEIAKAARPFAEPHDTSFAQYEALRAALSALDGDT